MAASPRAIDLRPLFAPRSMALVGASPKNDTARILRENISRVGASTRPFWVNPKYDTVDGATCYPDLASLPEVPDVVLAMVGPARAASIIREAAALGVPAAIVPGGGVIEGGEIAAQMQREVAAIALEHGMALLGPNCMGLVDLHAPSASYIDDLPFLRRGGTAAIAQSGSVANAFVNAGPRIGWSRIISCGSEVVLDVCDYMAACLDDPVTDSIILFVEGFKRPELFLALADRALAQGVPVMAVKVGRSPQAQAAAVSHSGSLAGDTRATEAAMRAAGVILCDDLDALLEAAALVSSSRRLGRRVGAGRTALVTVSTGEASLIADLAPGIGLALPDIPTSAASTITAAMPTLTHVENPIDPWGAGDADPTYATTLGALADSGAFDVVGLVHDFPYAGAKSETDLALGLGSVLIDAVGGRAPVLPVFVSLTSGDVPLELVEQMEAAGGAPILRGIASGLAAIPKLAAWEASAAARTRHGPVRSGWPALAERTKPCGIEGLPGLAAAPAPPGRVIPERESLELLAAAGIPVVASVAVEGRTVAGLLAGATAAAEQVGWPVAVKLDAPGLAHKSDIGAVELDVANATQLGAALRRVLAAGRDHAPDGVLIQPMARKNVELIVGARRDAQFGPIVLVGLGGVFAEILDDVAVGLAPVRHADALELLTRLRQAHVLDGVRGRRPVNRNAIADLIVALSAAMLANPTWNEVDINPVMASSTGAFAVDALIVADVAHPDWDYEDPGGTSHLA
ncbi:MAG TPA: acetate--CoA ligase family protein [Candidatus Limnocylindrales bacterium]|nr:acetate--CoA ligase family protein [Candidatus Limnocylindrales bacterium]